MRAARRLALAAKGAEEGARRGGRRRRARCPRRRRRAKSCSAIPSGCDRAPSACPRRPKLSSSLAQRRVVRDDAVVEAVGDVERAARSVEREPLGNFSDFRAGAPRADAAEHLRTHAGEGSGLGGGGGGGGSRRRCGSAGVRACDLMAPLGVAQSEVLYAVVVAVRDVARGFAETRRIGVAHVCTGTSNFTLLKTIERRVNLQEEANGADEGAVRPEKTC